GQRYRPNTESAATGGAAGLLRDPQVVDARHRAISPDAYTYAWHHALRRLLGVRPGRRRGDGSQGTRIDLGPPGEGRQQQASPPPLRGPSSGGVSASG